MQHIKTLKHLPLYIGSSRPPVCSSCVFHVEESHCSGLRAQPAPSIIQAGLRSGNTRPATGFELHHLLTPRFPLSVFHFSRTWEFTERGDLLVEKQQRRAATRNLELMWSNKREA